MVELNSRILNGYVRHTMRWWYRLTCSSLLTPYRPPPVTSGNSTGSCLPPKSRRRIQFSYWSPKGGIHLIISNLKQTKAKEYFKTARHSPFATTRAEQTSPLPTSKAGNRARDSDDRFRLCHPPSILNKLNLEETSPDAPEVGGTNRHRYLLSVGGIGDGDLSPRDTDAQRTALIRLVKALLLVSLV